jgi:hypothetical protein
MGGVWYTFSYFIAADNAGFPRAENGISRGRGSKGESLCCGQEHTQEPASMREN